MDTLSTLLKIAHNILPLYPAAVDEEPDGLMNDFISKQEKTIWMMNALLRY